MEDTIEWLVVAYVVSSAYLWAILVRGAVFVDISRGLAIRSPYDAFAVADPLAGWSLWIRLPIAVTVIGALPFLVADSRGVVTT